MAHPEGSRAVPRDRLQGTRAQSPDLNPEVRAPHYSRADVSGAVEQQNTNYYDTQAVSHSVLSGQLYWGHAYYVRKEIASTSIPRHWQQSLREAILREVLGFDGLAKQLLIDAVRNGAPSELRGGLANE
jgi:hypothetical protein